VQIIRRASLHNVRAAAGSSAVALASGGRGRAALRFRPGSGEAERSWPVTEREREQARILTQAGARACPGPGIRRLNRAQAMAVLLSN